MTLDNTLPSYVVALAPLLLLGSLVLIRAVKLSFAWTLLATGVPLLAPAIVKAISIDSLKEVSAECAVGATWLAISAAAVVWAIFRERVKGAFATFGVVRLAYFTLLSLALVVTVLLTAYPAVVHDYIPEWRGSLGVVLFAASLLSMALSLARVCKAFASFAIWAAVSVVLGCEVFFGKMPQQLFKEDLKTLESWVPQGLMGGDLATYQGASGKPRARPGVVLGDSDSGEAVLKEASEENQVEPNPRSISDASLI